MRRFKVLELYPVVSWDAWLTSYNASLGSLSYPMFQRPLPPVLTDEGTSLTVVARYP